MTINNNNKPPERRAKMADYVKTIIKGLDENNSQIKVTAYYPQVNQPYRYDGKRTVPCRHEDKDAHFATNFTMDPFTAKSLFKVMKQAYDEKSNGKWDVFKMPFTKDDDGNFRYRARTGATYTSKSGEVIRKVVQQRDATGQLQATNFELTSDSRISLQVTLNPSTTHPSKVSELGDHTVTLWLDQILVHDLAPRKEYNPFGVTSGSFNSSKQSGNDAPQEDNPFEHTQEPVKEADPFGEETVEEPKKAAKKTAPPPTAAAQDDLSSIVEDWDD